MDQGLSRYFAAQLTAELLRRAAGEPAAGPNQLVVCLALSHENTGDMPVHARVMLMRESVAKTLEVFGLRAPVSLRHLKGLWWVARVDAASVYDNLEFGGGYCTRVVDTAALQHRYCHAYAEVTRGPFATEEEARGSLHLG